MSRPPLTELRDRVSVVLVQLEIPLSVVQRVAEVCQALRAATGAGSRTGATTSVGDLARRLCGQAERAGGGGADRHLGHGSDALRSWQRDGFSTVASAIAMITRGERGAVVLGPAGVAEYPAFPATPVDTTAAGDAFTGAFGASLARGASLPEALRRGLAAGALAVTVRGASPSLPTARGDRRFPRRSTLISGCWRFGLCGDRLLARGVLDRRRPIGGLAPSPIAWTTTRPAPAPPAPSPPDLCSSAERLAIGAHDRIAGLPRHHPTQPFPGLGPSHTPHRPSGPTRPADHWIRCCRWAISAFVEAISCACAK